MDEVLQAESGVTIKDGISLGDILSPEGATFTIDFDDLNNTRSEDERTYDEAVISNHLNFDCLGLQDEETYNDCEPFEGLAKKMTDLLEDGKVKKRIIREGVGDKLPENGTVTYNYNAYTEYSEEPFDSTYARDKPFRYQLGSGTVIPGVEIALQSMKINEKSQFLIHPDLAYGKLGCLDRVPRNATILFEIEVKNCQNMGAASTFDNLPEEEQRSFSKIYDYANALCTKGNDFYQRHLYKQAIREYNIAVSKLLHSELADYEDQEKQQLLLCRLYTNLVITYTKISEPRKACINCNELFRLVKGTNMKVSAKVYFNNARALMMLGDFEQAERKLKIAKRMEPNNPTISQEFIKLDTLKKKNYDREITLAKAIFKSNEINQEPSEEQNITDELKKLVNEYCEELTNNSEMSQFCLPSDLNQEEIAFIENEAKKFGLSFRKVNNKHFISKKTE